MKSLVLGGPFAIGLTFSLVMLLVSAVELSTFGMRVLLGSMVGYGLSLAGLLWATGFWGRLPMALMFGVAPLLLVVDFVANPFFPSGAVFVAVAALGMNSRRDA